MKETIDLVEEYVLGQLAGVRARRRGRKSVSLGDLEEKLGLR